MLLASSSTALGQSEPLTLDEALKLAVERSQQLIADDAAAEAARAMAVAAARAPDPTLTVGIDNLPVNGPDKFSLTDDFMTMRSIGLARELTHGDKRDARAARFTSEADAAAAARVVALADLQRGAAMAWLERHYREQIRDALVRQRDEAALQIEAADLAFRSGVGMQSDAFAARSSVARIEDKIAKSESDIEVATVKLARWIGDGATRPLAAAPATDVVSLQAADLEGELGHHPEIALMIKQEELARADADLARTGKRSDWSVELKYSQRGPDFSNLISINFSKPLQWNERNRQDQDLAAKLALAAQAHAEREEATRVHVADARALLAAWRGNRQRLERYSSTLLPLASERTRAAVTAYRAGKGALSAVLEARVDEIETTLDHLTLEMDTAALWAEINFLIPAGSHHE